MASPYYYLTNADSVFIHPHREWLLMNLSNLLTRVSTIDIPFIYIHLYIVYICIPPGLKSKIAGIHSNILTWDILRQSLALAGDHWGTREVGGSELQARGEILNKKKRGFLGNIWRNMGKTWWCAPIVICSNKRPHSGIYLLPLEMIYKWWIQYGISLVVWGIELDETGL